MGKQGSLINPEIEAQAEGLMALDCLCPEPSRQWARLHLAVAHWHRLDPDPKVNSQGKLAGKIKNKKTRKNLSVTQISGARMPPKKKRRKGCGLDDDMLKQIAAVIDVEPDWLIAGYAENGRNVWPAWLLPHIENAQSTLRDILMAYLLEAQRCKPVPSVIAQALEPYRKMIEKDIATLPCKVRPAVLPEEDQADLISMPLRALFESSHIGFIDRLLRRSEMGVNAYLSRYRQFIEREIAELIKADQKTLPTRYALAGLAASDRRIEGLTAKQHELFGIKADEEYPAVSAQRWLKRLSVRDRSKR